MQHLGKNEERWYIAAPFFNAQQIAVVQSIEMVLATCRRAYFSPRLSGPSLAAKQLSRITDEVARTIFDFNVRTLERTNRIVAYFGWDLPKDRAIMEVALRYPADAYPLDMESITYPLKGPLNLPDAGTVWETGWGVAKGIPIFGIFGANQVPNLMLTQCCEHTFTHVDVFETWLLTYDPVRHDPSGTTGWKGEQQ